MREEDIFFTVVDTDHAVIAALEEANPLIGTLFGKSVELLEGSDARVLATLDLTGDPAIIAQPYGDSQALLIGTFLRMANHAEQRDANNRFIVGLSDCAGVEQPVCTSHDGRSEDPVVARLHRNDQSHVLFLINHGHRDEAVTVTVEVEETGPYSLRELVQDRHMTLEATDNQLVFEVDLGARNVEAWEIRPR